MNHFLGFLPKTRFLLLAILMACQSGGVAQQLSESSVFRIEKPAPLFKTDKVQLELMQAQCDREDRRMRNLAILFSMLFVFGAFCAIWAQNDHRNGALWFLIGFSFNIVAVLAILYINRRHRHRKRYRRVISYWGMS